MSNGTTPTTATAPSNGNGNGDVTSVSYWLGYLAKQGPMTVFLGAITYFLFFYIVIPMRDDQKRYIDAVIETNKANAVAFGELKSTHQTGFTDLKSMHAESNKRLDGILQAQNDQLPILKQIRDESKAWNQPRSSQ